MPKYLIEFSYTAEGVKGLLKEGGTARREETTRLVESVGGTVEAYYFTFGRGDGIILADIPDQAGAAAASLTGSATGAVRVRTTVLITPEEMDEAARKKTEFRAPGA
ncbi:MAG: GYD domain-containing protein [Candidatus Dormibacteraeota bacterium]|nr:GYD domain-containing protein [Candidatus Dormibacteraeota bacterium]MBV9526564.1 GYD domain-containing protein [Candidatus Dormibacteraeota bacterium]